MDIFRDVTFDENVLSFSTLHPNAGARLTSEVLLLPQHSGGRTVHDDTTNAPTNPSNESLSSAENPGENDAACSFYGGDFMQATASTAPGVDLLAGQPAVVGGSPAGSMPRSSSTRVLEDNASSHTHANPSSPVRVLHSSTCPALSREHATSSSGAATCPEHQESLALGRQLESGSPASSNELGSFALPGTSQPGSSAPPDAPVAQAPTRPRT